ncbi:MAG: substrate-binding domain-containing protein, partial [Planctomycetes bacterium]|nr:substrate-binding domain-containing protein [Planctomycetota bacterium]
RDKNVTAIFGSSSKLVTSEILPAIKNMGLSIPDDFSVVAYDNTSDTEACDIPLTVIDTDISALGQLSGKLLLENNPVMGHIHTTTTLQGDVLSRVSVKNIQ